MWEWLNMDARKWWSRHEKMWWAVTKCEVFVNGNLLLIKMFITKEEKSEGTSAKLRPRFVLWGICEEIELWNTELFESWDFEKSRNPEMTQGIRWVWNRTSDFRFSLNEMIYFRENEGKWWETFQSILTWKTLRLWKNPSIFMMIFKENSKLKI